MKSPLEAIGAEPARGSIQLLDRVVKKTPAGAPVRARATTAGPHRPLTSRRAYQNAKKHSRADPRRTDRALLKRAQSPIGHVVTNIARIRHLTTADSRALSSRQTTGDVAKHPAVLYLHGGFARHNPSISGSPTSPSPKKPK